ncbi:MAG: MFS transporter [Erysipelotrichaceae bacterium]|nr:MFS transporter [Erysipelotrichaceae bacterium]MBQ1522555.1 MFS transporter [Erysipelotrichaceae bacterium]
MKITKQIILFFAYYFMHFFAQAISYALLITFLTTLGYTATQRSLFFVADALFGMIFQVILGYLCDRHQKIKPYLYLLLLIYVIGTYALYRTTEMNFLVHMFLVPLVGSMLRLSASLSDSLTIETSEETRDNYGVIRLFGSIGWAVGSPVAAWIVAKWGYPMLGPSFIIFMALCVASILGIKDVKKVSSSDPVTMSDVQSLLRNPSYMLTVIILFLLFVVDMTQSYSVIDKIWYLNGSEKDVGNYWLMAAMLELPLFFYGGRVMQKIGSFKTIIIAGFFYGLRYVIYGLANSILFMFVGGALQGVTYPLLMVASKIMVDEKTPENMRTSGQQVANAVYNSGSALVSPILVGLMEDNIGINNSLFVIAAMALITTVITVFINKKQS